MTANGNIPVDELFKRLSESETGCLLKKHLTPSIFNKLKDKRTQYGGKFAQCIRTGCIFPQSISGVYASDPDAYDVFWDIFSPVIQDYHKTNKSLHPDTNFGDLDNLDFNDLDPENKYILSTRIRVGRNHSNYGFPPTLTNKDRLDMELMATSALSTLTGELAGTYYPLQDMTSAEQKQLKDEHFLFPDHNPIRVDVGFYDDWPAGRGIFLSKNKRFLVWVNEEDHLRIISMQQGGNLAEVWQRLVKGVATIEQKLSFARHSKLGYLTFCPTNLGTTLRASVHIRIPHLSRQTNFKEILEGLNLDLRGVGGEYTDHVGDIFDLSNKRRLGLTEIEAVQEMRRGVEKVIEMEKELSNTCQKEETDSIKKPN